MTCEEFTDKLFPKPEDGSDNLQPKPDCKMMYLELQEPGVTKMLLWQEYYNEVRAAGNIPLQYSQFCNYFNQYIERNKATMHFDHKIIRQLKELKQTGYAKILITNLLQYEYLAYAGYGWYSCDSEHALRILCRTSNSSRDTSHYLS